MLFIKLLVLQAPYRIVSVEKQHKYCTINMSTLPLLVFLLLIEFSFESCVENPKTLSQREAIHDRWGDYAGSREVLVTTEVTIICSDITTDPQLPTTRDFGTKYSYPIYLKVQQSRVSKIPSSFFMQYQGITKLYLSGNKIAKMVPGALNGLSKLEELYLDDNNLEEVTGGQYNSLHIVRILSLSRNKIKTVSENSFMGMNQLQKLILNENQISYLDDIIFEPGKILNFVDLSHNCLPEINETFINTSITFLNVSSNVITDIYSENFPKTLKDFDVKNNSITRLQNWKPNEIGNTGEVNYDCINFSFNKIKSIGSKTFSKSSIKLNVSNNIISVLQPDSFYLLSLLVILDLHQNNLTEIPNNCFSDLKSLEILDLSFNTFFELRYGVFNNLENLQDLNIAHNKLTNLKSETFHSLQRLTKLNIEYNLLHSIDAYHLELYLPKLNNLVLDNNSWDCKSLIKLIHTLKMKNVNIAEGHTFNDSNVIGVMCVEYDLDTSSIDNDSTGKLITKLSQIEKGYEDIKQMFNQSNMNNILDNYFNEFEKRRNKSEDTDNRDFNYSKLEGIQNNSMQNYFNKYFENSTFFKYIKNLKIKNDSNSKSPMTLQDINSLNSTLHNYLNTDFQKSNFYKYMESFKLSFKGNQNNIGNDELISAKLINNFEAGKRSYDPSSFLTIYFILIILLIGIVIIILFISYAVFFRKQKFVNNVSREQVELLSNSSVM